MKMNFIVLIIFFVGILIVFPFDKIKAQKNTSESYEKTTLLADSFYNESNFNQALVYYQKALVIAKENPGPDHRKLISAIGNVGFVYYTTGRYVTAQVYFKEAIAVCRNFNDSTELSINLSNYAQCMHHMGEYGEAILNMNEALQIEKKLNNDEGQSVNLNSLGKIYEKWGKYREAIDFYNQALLIDRKQNNLERIAIRLSGIGSAYTSLKDYNNAMKYQKEALEIAKKHGNKERIAIRLERLGVLYQKTGDYKTAEIYLKQAFETYKDIANKNLLATIMLHLAKNQQLQGNIEQGEIYYKQCIKLVSELNYAPLLLDVNKEVAGFYYQTGDYKRAFDYLGASIAYKDSIFSDESNKQINEFRQKYEAEKLENDKKLLLKDNEIRQRNLWFLIAVTVSLLIITFIITVLYNIKSKSLRQNKLLLLNEQELTQTRIKQKDAENKLLEDRIFAEKQINRLQAEKHQAEMENKNMKLTSATLCLINKNEVLSELMNKLEPAGKNEQVNQALAYIRSNTDADQNWRKFKLDFEVTHAGFFDRLQSKYTNLSEYDQRVCAFLLIGLSSREIAGLMSVSLDAVNKNRQRLRKKLLLEPETDLAEALTRI